METFKKHIRTSSERRIFEEDYSVLLEHEFDDYGNHRLIVKPVNGKERKSEWESYTGIARTVSKNRHFAATTEYYSGVLPRVFELKAANAVPGTSAVTASAVCTDTKE